MPLIVFLCLIVLAAPFVLWDCLMNSGDRRFENAQQTLAERKNRRAKVISVKYY